MIKHMDSSERQYKSTVYYFKYEFKINIDKPFNYLYLSLKMYSKLKWKQKPKIMQMLF